MFLLRFAESRLKHWSQRYDIESDKEVENGVAPCVQKVRYYTKEQLRTVCKWKSPRSIRHCERNSEQYVETITALALSTCCDRLRIEVLALLDGVGWPTASVLLHFGYGHQYPILDVRALWSLSVDPLPRQYDYDFWQQYTQYCQQTAKRYDLTMRELDRALWQYSKERQDG